MRELRHFVLAALLLSGCVTARIDYSVGNVRPVSSQFASSTVSVSRFQDMRYEDKRSVSTHATRLGAFNKGTQFTADMKGFDEVFAKVKPTADDSFYVAPIVFIGSLTDRCLICALSWRSICIKRASFVRHM